MVFFTQTQTLEIGEILVIPGNGDWRGTAVAVAVQSLVVIDLPRHFEFQDPKARLAET